MGKIVSVTVKGDYKKTDGFLHRIIQRHYMNKLRRFGEIGVNALAAATPRDTGETSKQWFYEITDQNGRLVVSWHNRNINDGVNIAIILQYGHGTNHGGYVEGIDYINPAIRPIFKRMADETWKEIIS